MNLDKEFLLSVQRPARYIGGEYNSIRKDPSAVKIKLALAFPDIYEIGMSNLGYRIIYDILNRYTDVLCERVFCPWSDMEKALRGRKLKLFTLENKIPLDQFDVVAFSLNHELNYTNVLTMLDLAQIPFRSADRSDLHPLIISGGMSCLNPEPIKDIFDAIFIGEGEVFLPELTKILREFNDKKSRLEALANIEGVFVPKLFKDRKKISKRFVKDLSIAHAPKNWIVPFIQIVHDRVAVELMRGCPNACRFCQGRSSYWPLRIRKAEDVVEIAEETIRSTGYEELSLLSLSACDHPNIIEIYQTLLKKFEKKGISVSLPSIRARSDLKEILPLWAKNKKSTLTLVPEAGSQRLRDLINKNVSVKELLDCAQTAFECGWRSIKLYFMIGLPTEKDEDLRAMVDLIIELAVLGKAYCKGRPSFNVSINTFIPKPHTAFQWCEMISKVEIYRRKRLIQEYLVQQRRVNRINANIEISFHNENISFLEGIFSRGDDRLFNVLVEAWKNGARFDSWSSELKPDIWEKAFHDCSIDPEDYFKKRQVSDNLVWGYVDAGISKDNLLDEYKKCLNFDGELV